MTVLLPSFLCNGRDGLVASDTDFESRYVFCAATFNDAKGYIG